MSLNSKKPVIGHKYHIGQHLVYATNKLAILAIMFQDKEAWTGRAVGGQQITVNKPELFGGEEREGGVSGNIDVLDGAVDQIQNDYLEAQLGSPVSAFRHVTSLVFRQFYMGNNYYIKPPNVKVWDNQVRLAWLPAKADFIRESTTSKLNVHLSIDSSGSMAGARFTAAKVAGAAFIRSLKGQRSSVKVIMVGVTSITILNCTDADYETIALWIEAYVLVWAVASYVIMANDAKPFHATARNISGTTTPFINRLVDDTLSIAPRTICLIIGDGENADYVDAGLIYDTIPDVEIFCFSVDNPDPISMTYLDNTPQDGVPEVTSVSPDELVKSLASIFASWVDLNPAHIFYDLLTATQNADNINTSLIGDSFEAAANTLYDEDFGLSFVWRDTDDQDRFRRRVQAHIDGSLYFDNSTGQWEIKLIRDDYDIGTLPMYDTTTVVEWKSDVNKEVAKNLPNKVVVTYRKQADNKKKSISDVNPVSLELGYPLNIKVLDYEGVYDDDLAVKILARDLRATTLAKWSGTIVVTHAPATLNVGSAFLINNSEFGINNVVARVLELRRGAGSDRKVTIRWIEDMFSLGTELGIDVSGTPQLITSDALPTTIRVVEEVPYYNLVLANDQSDVDAALVDEPLLGYMQVAAAAPDNWHLDATVMQDTVQGWIDVDTVLFAPTKQILTDIAQDASVVTVELLDSAQLNTIEIGSLAKIDNELLRVDAVATVGVVTTLTFGRGCLDTVPEYHSAYTNMLFLGQTTSSSEDEFLHGEAIDIKLLPRIATERLFLDDAPADTLTFAHRAIRPYPVGNLKLDGDFAPAGILDEVVPITWAHRDRTTQTTTEIEDYADGDIGPEAGVNYVLDVRAVLERDDFFSGTNFFEEADFFSQGGMGTLINSLDMRQNTEHVYDGSGSTSNFFGQNNFFGPDDFFADTPLDFFSPDDFFSPYDFFGVVAGRALQTQISINVTRDGYENWTVATTQGRHLAAPSILTGELV